MADEKKADLPSDVIVVGETLPNGDASFVRYREDEAGPVVQGGTLRVLSEDPSEDGSDVDEVVRLSHVTDNVYNVVETVRKGGPAMVNSPAFRNGWETLFGNRQTVGQA